MTSSITTQSGLELPILSAMRYCKRNDFKDPQAYAEQRYVAFELYKKFNTGTYEVNRNPALAQEFLMKATGAKPTPTDNFDAEAFTTLLAIYTTVRLFLVRLDRAFKALNQLLHITSAFLPRFFGFFGFSYFLEYLVLAGINSYEAYQAMQFNKKPNETSWGAFKRCYGNALAVNPRRQYRMDNALRWGPINLISTFLGPVAFAVVNIWGFFRDVVNEADNAQANDIYSDRTIIKSIDDLMAEKTTLENEIAELQQKRAPDSQENTALETQLKEKQARLLKITQHTASFTAQKKQLSNELVPQYKKQGLEMFLVVLILAGVILYATPGLNLIAFTAGAFCVLTASVFYLYNRYKQAKDFVAPSPEKIEKTADLQEKDVSDEEISHVLIEKVNHYLDTIEATPSPTARENPNEDDIIDPSPSPSSPSASQSTNGSQGPEETAFSFQSPASSITPPSPTLPYTPTHSRITTTEVSEPQQAAILNIYLLYYVFCQIETAANNDLATIFLAFSVNEINKLRLILGFKSSIDWAEQWSLWTKHKPNAFTKPVSTNTQITRTHYYDCSLKQTLFSKIKEENEEHKASENDERVKKIVTHINSMALSSSHCHA